ncbi:MAG: DUF3048 domain-containing protein [Sedimentibacter sp.]|nr:DUF3048 domain-containing protein [Tissierellia bacterium]MDD4046141.1 DUF3048 domain-containing protein [Tissierellia bacterium]
MKTRIVVLIIFLLFISGCAAKTVDTPEVEEPEKIVPEIEDEPEEIEEEIDPNMVVSQLDGLRYYPEELSKRPVAVSIDNHPRARWQAGLSQAEIVYEVEVEHPFTRYLCIFLAKEPERIGPVRSARPYLIYYALEYDGIFVHVGGSEDAFAEIRRLSAADVDGLYSGAMWRYNDTGKYAPHNMYTTLESIRDEAEYYGYRTEAEYEGYMFKEKDEILSENFDINSAKEVNIVYNDYNTTDYIYEEENSLYLRFKDEEEHIDELDKKQITAKNIIAIETSKTVLDNEGRLFLGTIGQGNGIYITNGESIPITWEKASEKDKLRFYSGDEELVLNPGNTWIQVVNSLDRITIK